MPREPATRFVFQPVQLVRPCEVVAFRISEAIRAGDVRVGDRLPSELNLAQQLGVGRTTLRDAIKLLAQAGVLSVRPGSSGGIFVASQQVPQELCAPPLPGLALHDIASTLEARRLIEPLVARLAAAHATAADLVAMHEAVDLSARAARPFRRRRIDAEGIELMTLASTRFNIAVARATQNSVIVQVMAVLLQRMDPVRRQALADLSDVTLSTRTLAQLLDAIESGDADAIDSAVSERIGMLEAAWERASGRRLRRRPALSAPPPAPTVPLAAAAAKPRRARATQSARRTR